MDNNKCSWCDEDMGTFVSPPIICNVCKGAGVSNITLQDCDNCGNSGVAMELSICKKCYMDMIADNDKITEDIEEFEESRQ